MKTKPERRNVRPEKLPAYAALGAALVGGAAILGYAIWWRKNPSACPYSQRFWVEAPHPFITRRRLREALVPEPGERMLEVGPGTGYYALSVAEWLGPTGTLDVFDLQQEMLDHVMLRAQERGIANIRPSRGDARSFPYSDDTFDAAYLAVVLGEVPDQDAALRELYRVLKPGARLIVGEICVDPHFVTFGSLRMHAEAAGMRLERRIGSRLAYFAAFRVPR